MRAHARLRSVLPERIELKAAGGLVEAERAVKEPGEVEKIAAAAALGDEVYDWLREQGLVGRTEREVAFALEMAMRRRGASWTSIPTPCPSPWPKCSPWPAPSIMSRATASTSAPVGPGRTASSAASCARSVSA